MTTNHTPGPELVSEFPEGTKFHFFQNAFDADDKGWLIGLKWDRGFSWMDVAEARAALARAKGEA
jgi:hypothetical protein